MNFNSNKILLGNTPNYSDFHQKGQATCGGTSTAGGYCFWCDRAIRTLGIDRQTRRCQTCDRRFTAESLLTRKPACGSCGSEKLKINLLESGPHAAELRCENCGRWQRWISRKTLAAGGVA